MGLTTRLIKTGLMNKRMLIIAGVFITFLLWYIWELSTNMGSVPFLRTTSRCDISKCSCATSCPNVSMLFVSTSNKHAQLSDTGKCAWRSLHTIVITMIIMKCACCTR